MLDRYPQNVASVYLKLQIESVPISSLKNDPDNARKHDAKNLKAITGSLEKFGQQKPLVVDADGIIIAGNGTFEAAKKLKWTHIDVVRTKLDKVTARAYALADNRTSELGEWDDEALTSAIKSLHEIDFDLSSIGFDEKFVQGYVRSSAKGNIEDDEVPDVQKNIHNVRQGQIWQLGDHRLMCSDATNELAVSDLMNSCKADMVFTDPPYNVSLGMDETIESAQARNRRTDGLIVKNDKFKDRLEFQDFLLHAFKRCNENMRTGASIYVAHSVSEQRSFSVSFEEAGFKLRQVCIWVKSSLVMGRQDYQWKHEPILYGWKEGSSHLWNSDRTQTTVWEFNKPSSSKLHPTMKPIELIEYTIQNSSNEKQSILDLFGGSGSTLIACEKTKRKCFMMKIDEHYCSVIIERWQQFTGNKAQLLGTV